MKYEEIPAGELRELRFEALKKKPVILRSILTGPLAIVIGFAIAEVWKGAFDRSHMVGYLVGAFVAYGLGSIFSEVYLEPAIRREVERIKNA